MPSTENLGLKEVVAPFTIALGGVITLFAAYSLLKLGIYYKDDRYVYIQLVILEE